MKLSRSCLVVLTSLLVGSQAWVVPQNVSARTKSSTALQANNNPWSTAAVALTGWALATQVASAGMMPPVDTTGAYT